jgi:hypothetical protein
MQPIPGAVSSGVKRPCREADHLPPSSAEAKNYGAKPPFPNTSSWNNALFVKYKNKFTFTTASRPALGSSKW